MKNKFFSIPGITIGFSILFISVLFISPEVKAFVFNNLAQIGLIRSDDNIKPEVTAERPSSPETAGNNEAPLAPSVLFKDGNGNTIDISKQKGKVLFINFWATWCPPCIAEMPSIAKLKSELSNNKDILFLMVDVDDNYKKSKKFMDSNKYNLPVYSPAGPIPSDFLSGSIPTTIIIDKAGRVVGRHEGGADYYSPEAVKFFKRLL